MASLSASAMVPLSVSAMAAHAAASIDSV